MAGVLAVIVWIGSIVAANVLTARFGFVPVGFGLVATAGTYAAGFALLARDFVHRYANIWFVYIGILVGSVLSWILASPALAIASTAAFAVAELVDLAVYVVARRRRGFVTSAAISNVVSAPLDTVVFLALAGFPITWPILAGQIVGKLLWATAVPLAIYEGIRRAIFRESRRRRISDPRRDVPRSDRLHRDAETGTDPG